MSRYIDADALIKQMKSSSAYNDYEWSMYADGFIEDIENAPSIDIVFCKECKWFRKAPNTEHDYDNSCGVWASICEEDGFCNYGERREP